MSRVLSAALVARTRQISDETLVLALEAYRERRHQGVELVCTEVEGLARAIIADLEVDSALTPAERITSIEALEKVRAELRRMARRAAHGPGEKGPA